MERAAERAEELNKEGCNVKTVYNDASKKETYASMVEEVMKNEGKIDILVNNFGTSNPQKDKDIKTTEYVMIGTMWSFAIAIAAGLLVS